MLDVAAISDYVNERFGDIGKNKRQEIMRLLFEISKRESRGFKEVLDQESKKTKRFFNLKKNLIKRRYPNSRLNGINEKIRLPSVNTNPGLFMTIKERFSISPKNVVVEESVQGSDMVKRFKKIFPGSKFSIISNYQKYFKENSFTIADYNNRVNNFFIVKEKYDFFVNCPCSSGSEGCRYHIMKLGMGCAFECMYCYMQAYINSPGIVIPANINDFFDKFLSYPQDVRLGNGQFTDSLIFDHMTAYSPLIVDFFRKHPNAIFEFKTKSDNIDLLLNLRPPGNIVVSWSLNPQKIIDEVEFYTASLERRLDAAYKCFNAGYRVGFHFDPVILYENCEKDYEDIVSRVFALIPADRVAWISLGTLRMTTKLKQIIENRFPENKILDGEMVLGYDSKLRYGFDARLDIYKKLNGWIKEFDEKVPVYLCMEEIEMCKKTGIFPCSVF